MKGARLQHGFNTASTRLQHGFNWLQNLLDFVVLLTLSLLIAHHRPLPVRRFHFTLRPVDARETPATGPARVTGSEGGGPRRRRRRPFIPSPVRRIEVSPFPCPHHGRPSPTFPAVCRGGTARPSCPQRAATTAMPPRPLLRRAAGADDGPAVLPSESGGSVTGWGHPGLPASCLAVPPPTKAAKVGGRQR